MSSPYFFSEPPKQRQGPNLEVFLSHAGTDTEHVALVQRQIEALGISVYLAEHDPKPGTVVADKVEAAIERSQAVVVLITTNSVDSAYVQQEVRIAHRSRKPIVPIVEKGIDTRQLGILQGVEYLELDLAQPAETMAKMTASLQPLVLKQLEAMKVTAPVPQTVGADAATALLLIGLGLILGLMVLTAISSQSSGSA
jgi:hypothetical protein